MNPEISFVVTRHVYDSGAWGTLWHLSGQEPVPICNTLERTYEDALKRIKIPDGIWYCTRRIHGVSKGAGYPAWEIHVPGHRYIDIHIANFESEIDGCLALGESFTVIAGERALGSSGVAFEEFMALTKDVDDFFIKFVTDRSKP